MVQLSQPAKAKVKAEQCSLSQRKREEKKRAESLLLYTHALGNFGTYTSRFPLEPCCTPYYNKYYFEYEN